MNKHSPTGKRGKRYLRKRQVAERYGVSVRTADRMAADGRIPPWIYLPGSKLPMQLEDALDENDRRATVGRPSQIAAA